MFFFVNKMQHLLVTALCRLFAMCVTGCSVDYMCHTTHKRCYFMSVQHF